MNDHLPAISLIISVNDLEAQQITEIAEAYNIEVWSLGLDWGQSAAFKLARDVPINALKPTVIMVECPCPAYEDAVRLSGRVLHVVDHHLVYSSDGQRLDRRSDRSSLEQFSDIINHRAKKTANCINEHHLISANDSGYWPGLIKAALSQGLSGPALIEECMQIRARDRSAHLETTIDRALKDLIEATDFVEKMLENRRLIKITTFENDEDDGAVYVANITESETNIPICDGIYLSIFGKIDVSAKPPLRTPMIILIVSDDVRRDDCKIPPNGARKLFLSGSAELGLALEGLTDMIRSRPDGADLTLYAGSSANSAFLGVEGDDDISPIIDQCLAELLAGEKPVLDWSSQFMQFVHLPYSFEPAAGAEPTEMSEMAKAYFSPAVVDRMDGAPKQHSIGIRSYTFTNQQQSLQVDSKTGTLRAPLNYLALHCFPEKMVAVEWAARHGVAGPIEGQPWWAWLIDLKAPKAAVDAKQDTTVSNIQSAGQLLEFNAFARFTASAYDNSDWIAKISHSPSEASVVFGKEVASNQSTPSGWFESMLDALIKKGAKPESGDAKPDEFGDTEPRIMFDARARSVHGISLSFPRPQTAFGKDREDRLLAQLMAVDRYGKDWTYEPDFARDELESSRYRRFAQYGTHYGITGYSLVAMGYGKLFSSLLIGNAWPNAWGPTKKNPVREGHLPALYARMFMLPQIAIVVFDQLEREHGRMLEARIALEGGSRIDLIKARRDYNNAVRILHERLSRFLATMWFVDVSPELQAQDLYKLIREKTTAGRRLEHLHRAIQDADAVEIERQRRDDEHVRENVGILVALAGGISFGLATTQWVADKLHASDAPAARAPAPQGCFDWIMHSAPPLVALVAVMVMISCIFGWVAAALTLRHLAASREGDPLTFGGACRKVSAKVLDWARGKPE